MSDKEIKKACGIVFPELINICLQGVRDDFELEFLLDDWVDDTLRILNMIGPRDFRGFPEELNAHEIMEAVNSVRKALKEEAKA